MTHFDLPIRPIIDATPASRIRQVAEAGFHRPNVLPLWFGEGDQVTADFICQAAVSALQAGKTFYGENRGLPALREEIARYVSNLRGRSIDPERVTVMPSGVNAIMILMQCLIDPGDNVVMVSPVWPNCDTAVRVMSGEVRRVSLKSGPTGWTLDVNEVERLCNARTRAIFVNSPNNPTGWMATAAEMQALVSLARSKGIWLISDEVYDRIVYEGNAAVSALEFADEDDLVIAVNSFSKAWRMTGWRLGWVVAPRGLGQYLAKLNEVNMSNPPVFIQHAGLVALRDGESVVQENRTRYAAGRELVMQTFSTLDNVVLHQPSAAFYAFFKPTGVHDSLGFAQKLLTETGVGVAPGIAFGEEGEGWCRLCFAAGEDRLVPALDRLVDFLRKHTG